MLVFFSLAVITTLGQAARTPVKTPLIVLQKAVVLWPLLRYMFPGWELLFYVK